MHAVGRVYILGPRVTEDREAPHPAIGCPPQHTHLFGVPAVLDSWRRSRFDVLQRYRFLQPPSRQRLTAV